MSRIPILTAVGLALAAGLSAGALQAQTGAIPSAAEEVMVRVDVGEVEAELAAELGIGTDALPRSVEVNVDVAAIVCDIPVEQLEQVRSVEQHVECKAATMTPELAAATEDQLEE